MHRPPFEKIYMDLAHTLAKRSHCVKLQVGAVMAKDTRVVSTGYNGPPKNTYNCNEKWPGVGCPRSVRGGCSLALHAEENAVLYALKNKISLEGAILYVTLSPCLACARILFSVGIKKVFYRDSYATYKGLKTDEGVDFLKRFGVEVVSYPTDITAS